MNFRVKAQLSVCKNCNLYACLSTERCHPRQDPTWQADGNDDCCSNGIEGFCGEGEGDCDRDSECAGSLVCGNSNCPWRVPAGDEDDCCMMPTNATSNTTTNATSCLHDTEYRDGTLFGDGLHVHQVDFKSCQSYCKSIHPTATHFTYHTSNSGWTTVRNTCWCTAADATPGYRSGAISGEVNCGSQHALDVGYTFLGCYQYSSLMMFPIYIYSNLNTPQWLVYPPYISFGFGTNSKFPFHIHIGATTFVPSWVLISSASEVTNVDVGCGFRTLRLCPCQSPSATISVPASRARFVEAEPV